MIVNNKILNLPPYISTTWNNVQGLYMKGKSLVITLLSGDAVSIDNLSPEIIEKIFNAHRFYLEQQENESDKLKKSGELFQQTLSSAGAEIFQMGQQAMEQIGFALQHNSAHANAPNLPEELLEQISAFAKIIIAEDPNNLPQAEPNCNCPHCQIANAIHGHKNMSAPLREAADSKGDIDEISPADLEFQPWHIEQISENLYSVTNKLDPQEKYKVFLGTPIGCTCGESNCVHIPAVLRTY